MHEISVLTKAVELVESVARDNGLDHVSFITLEVGELTGYVPLFFEKYFPVIKDLSEKELSEALSKVDVAAFARELKAVIEQLRKEVMS